MNAEAIIDSIAGSAGAQRNPEDYIGSDGLLYCGKCRTAKQYKLIFTLSGREKPVPILCRCGREELEREEAQRKRREELEKIRRLKEVGIRDRALLECTFERDDGTVPQLSGARQYVDSWLQRIAQNDGLLLWGGPGTGKTFCAACIANALTDKGVPVMMTNFARILNSLCGLYSDDKNEYIAELMRYPLLIIDDFGIERSTEFALEQVYNVIDERYKTRLPLIVTSNLSITTMENPSDTAHQRIYDRVLAMCIPVSFQGNNRRKTEKAIKIKNGKDLFPEED